MTYTVSVDIPDFRCAEAIDAVEAAYKALRVQVPYRRLVVRAKELERDGVTQIQIGYSAVVIRLNP